MLHPVLQQNFIPTRNSNSKLSFRSWWLSGKDHWHEHYWHPHSWACTSQRVPEVCLLLVHCSPLTSGHSVTGAQLCQLHKHHQQHSQQYGYDPCTKGIIALPLNLTSVWDFSIQRLKGYNTLQTYNTINLNFYTNCRPIMQDSFSLHC